MLIEVPKLGLPLKEDIQKDLIEQLVTQLDTEFWLKGTYPKQDVLEKRFKLVPLQLEELASRINSILSKRDLPLFQFKSSAIQEAERVHADLDPYFVVACTLLCDTLDKRARSVKLKAIGMSSKRFNVLLEDAAHLEFYRKRVDKAFKGTSESAKLSLSKNVEAGDLQSIKYFHEFSQEYDPNQELKLNLNKLINLFMEVLVRHVPVETVEAIASDFELKLLEG